MRLTARSFALAAAILIAFWLVWSRLRIWVVIRGSFWQILLVMAVIAVVLFLAIDHLLNRSR
jgi:hypothetical protein